MASLLFEAYELSVAEIDRRECITLSSQEIEDRKLSHVRLDRLGFANYCRDQLVEWIPIKDFDTDSWIYVPSESLFFRKKGIFRSSSNGLATGLSFYESIFHGLLEVVERHAHTWALLKKRALSVTNYLDFLSPGLKDELAWLEGIGVTIEINDISDELGIPCFYSVLADPTLIGMRAFNSGISCHVNKVTALESSILEALQSRAVAISGSREDLDKKHSAKGNPDLFSFWYKPENKLRKDFIDISSMDMTSYCTAIKKILEAAREKDNSLRRFLYYTYPSGEGTYVTRSILESAEQFGLCRDRIGLSVANFLKSVLR